MPLPSPTGWLLAAAGLASTALGGTVITANLPPDTAIVNIDARVDGAANSANN